jgi:catechol 2,3-dioxygenase-like lactoylglutathione lyase family enzyme
MKALHLVVQPAEAPGQGWKASSARMGTMIGRLHHVIVDCPDPAALAAFYSELLGLPIAWQEDDFVVVSRDDTSSGIGFQLAPNLQAPHWPHPNRPQQMHFDVMVDDVDVAEPRVLALGARRLASGDGGSRIYADPAGHPFCLIPRPAWAPPIGDPPGEWSGRSR